LAGYERLCGYARQEAAGAELHATEAEMEVELVDPAAPALYAPQLSLLCRPSQLLFTYPVADS